MLLYIVRHGDPIYNPDSLTPKGIRQAEALAKRFAVHGLDEVYSSPLIRAQQTAQPTCELLGLTCHVEEWTSENLAYRELSCDNGKGGTRWCFQQQTTELKNDISLYLGDQWNTAACFHGVDYSQGLKRIGSESDAFLKKLGYIRDGAIYHIDTPSEKRIAVFCHEGFGTTWMSHLLQIPPHIFWSSFAISHSSVSIFEFTNYENGITSPRCIALSDLSHIYGDRLPFQFQNYINL
jgi:Fructose-2,6-bisphosphatase